MGSYLLPNPLDGKAYLILKQILPDLFDAAHVPPSMWYHRDRAPSHYGIQVHVGLEFLETTSLDRTFCPILWTEREIGSRVGRNQTTVMWICDRWMQEGTTDRRDRSHPPQCTTSHKDRQIVRMAVTDLSVASRTVAKRIESVTHHSVSARTIRRRLQQSGLSARRPLLGLPLTQNHRRLRRQWCDERRMWVVEWNEVVFTDKSRICLQHHDGRIRVWRRRGERMLNSCVMHRHTGPAPGIMPARSPDLSPIENMWSMVAQRLTQITPPAATPDQLWQRVEAACSAVPQEHTQSLFESMPRRVAAVISNNGCYSGC
ncbi:transposable element Tcb1 transposase [Trichonephila clavipes]|nr:transposable element Tcb1 transposase [Trichonephila clavipes]